MIFPVVFGMVVRVVVMECGVVGGVNYYFVGGGYKRWWW